MTDKIEELDDLILRLQVSAAREYIPMAERELFAKAADALRTQRKEVVEECARLCDDMEATHNRKFLRGAEFYSEVLLARHAASAEALKQVATAFRNLKSA